MKRWISLLLALVLVLALCGCASKKTRSDPAVSGGTVPGGDAPATEPVQTVPTAPYTDPAQTEPPQTDAPDDTTQPTDEPTPSAPPASTEENAGGFTPELQRAYDMIQETYQADGEYMMYPGESYSYTSSYSYHVPNLLPNTPGAAQINEQIAARFASEAEESLDYISRGIGTALLSINWYIFIYDHVLQIVVTDAMDYAWVEYEVYYYDMDTGEALSPEQMLDRIVLTEDEFLAGVREAAKEQFMQQFSDLTEQQKQDYGFYDQLENQNNEYETMEYIRFYVDEAGHIGVYAPVASLAGAAWYYQNLYPTFRMG